MTDKPEDLTFKAYLTDDQFKTLQDMQERQNARMFESQERQRTAAEAMAQVVKDQAHDKAKDKRDYFAGQALAGMIGSEMWINTNHFEQAVECYKAADAMIAERDQ